MNTNATHCSDFTRAQMLRSGLAAAGQGLPTIETGMPAPAGTGLSRRSLLLRSAGLGLTIFGARALAPSAYEEGIEAAMAAAGDDRVLVSIFLPGGIYGLSILAPVGDPYYTKLRPTIAQSRSSNPADVFTADPRLQWHPSAAPLRTLYTEGKLAVMPAVGYTNATQSHFTSRHFWEVGETDPRKLYGWMGRYLDRNGVADNPLQGLTLGYTLQPSLAPAKVPVSTLGSPTTFDFWVQHVGDSKVTAEAVKALGRMGASAGSAEPELARVHEALENMGWLRDKLQPLYGLRTPFQTQVAYPETDLHLPTRLATIAEMLSRGLPLRCVGLTSDYGYDTHTGQHHAFDNGFKLDCQSIFAFQRDLEARGLADRVLIHVWSEFGRRVVENGSGSDHGAAGISFLIGSKVRGQMIGEYPGLQKLDEFDNLLATSDYRSLYCSLLEQWFGADAGPIIPGADSFARIPLLKT